MPDGTRADLIEAVAEGVKLSNLEQILDTHVNRLAVLRPQIDTAERSAFLAGVFAFLGDPYDFDFDFDFADATRQVCTEVIYRGLNGKGGVEFSLTERAGHPTLSADDIVMYSYANRGRFEVVAFAEEDPEGHDHAARPGGGESPVSGRFVITRILGRAENRSCISYSPEIDALAAESIRYTHAYTPSSCRPSLSTLLTGLPEHVHGVTSTDGPPLAEFDTIADRLDSAGYSTYQAGKFWGGGPPTNRGFSAFSPFTSFVGDLEIGRTGVDQIFDWVVTTDGPWFVWFSPLMPHSPHTAPPSYVQLYGSLGLSDAEVLYFAMISWFDEVAGELIAGLPADTVVIYLSDNGYVQSETPVVSAPRSKTTSYEHGIRTELLIRHPEATIGLRLDPVHAVDVSGTILALAGADSSGFSSRNLLNEDPRNDHVTGSTWVPFGSPGELIDRWVVTDDRWKLVDDEAGLSRLHDLVSDPDELSNLADDPAFADVRDELQLLIDVAFVPEPSLLTLNFAELVSLTILRRLQRIGRKPRPAALSPLER